MKTLRHHKKSDLEDFAPWRHRLHEIIYEADTKAGKRFDILLFWFIILSVICVMLESVSEIRKSYHSLLYGLEWGFTILFTIEYIVRIITIKKPLNYIFSFYGMIDLISIIPTYLSIIIVGSESLMVIRTIRLMRVFRVLKLVRFLKEAKILRQALYASRHKITIFIISVLTIVVIMGTIMYLLEGGESGFTSIPRSIYWAIVTLTTVGYGDIAPQTFLGQFLASIIMILGYAIIAVPTGIVSAELVKGPSKDTKFNTRACTACGSEGHDSGAKFCKNCGDLL